MPASSPFYHAPVMLNEVLHFLDCGKNQNVVDLTLGGSGHTQAILEKTSPEGLLLGLDRDPNAIKYGKEKLKSYGERVQLVQQKMSACGEVLQGFGLDKIDGVLMDCGVSSKQLDEAERGFAFMKEGPLDMRMNPGAGIGAEELLKSSSEEEIARIIFEFGEERFSRRIARNIFNCPSENLKTTSDLVSLVRRSLPREVRGKKQVNCIARTFQGIRIAVNHELEEITEALTWLVENLVAGARIVVLTFHSLEDRIVKNIFREGEDRGLLKRIMKKVVKPTDEETSINPRSRSAKLRVVEITGGSEL